MNEVFRTVEHLSTPIQLAGFLGALIMFAIYALLRSTKLERLKARHGTALILRAINWFGVLGIVALMTGLAARVAPLALSWAMASTPPMGVHPTTPSSVPTPPSSVQAPVDPAILKNATYVLDGEHVTLNDGEMAFDPPEDVENQSVYPTHVSLTNWAFGDLTKDGAVSAVVVLQQSDGGSGIYYSLAPVTRRNGRVISDAEGYTIGDRVQFKRLDIDAGKVFADVLMHRPDDPSSQPSILRHLEFVYSDGRLQCTSRPCSDSEAFDLDQKMGKTPPNRGTLAAPPPPPGSSIRPSFDCQKAKATAEVAICSSDELRALDADIGTHYRALYARLTDDRRQSLKHEQVAWIVERQSQCGGDTACLRDYLELRSAQLAGEYR